MALSSFQRPPHARLNYCGRSALHSPQPPMPTTEDTPYATHVIRVSAAEAQLLVQRDSRYQPLISHFGLLERTVHADIYTGLVITIMGQQLSNKARDVTDPEALHEVCVRSSENGERLLPFARTKISTLEQVTARFCSGQWSAAKLQAMTPEQRLAELCSVKGIGPWSVNMIEIMVFGDPDCFALGDYGVQQGWAMLTHRNLKKLSKTQLQSSLTRYARKVSPVGTAATLYLWAFKDIEGKLPQA